MIKARVIDLSVTGMLIEISKEYLKYINLNEEFDLELENPEGTMKEDYDHKVNIKALIVRYSN